MGLYNEFLEAVDYSLSNFPDKGEDVPQVDVEAESFQFAEYADHYRGSKVTSCCCAKSYIENDPSYIKHSTKTILGNS